MNNINLKKPKRTDKLEPYKELIYMELMFGQSYTKPELIKRITNNKKDYNSTLYYRAINEYIAVGFIVELPDGKIKLKHYFQSNIYTEDVKKSLELRKKELYKTTKIIIEEKRAVKQFKILNKEVKEINKHKTPELIALEKKAKGIKNK